MSFRLILKGKASKEILGSSISKLLEIFSANNFTLSDLEGNTLGPLNRGVTADLPQLRTLLWICQQSREPSFWEAITTLFY